VERAETAEAPARRLGNEARARGAQRGRVVTRHAARRVGQAIDALRELAAGLDPFEPFVVVLDDPAGNSLIESAAGAGGLAARDPALHTQRYRRTPEQVGSLGGFQRAS